MPGPAAHTLRFEQVHGTVGDLALPGLAPPISLDLQGVLKGVERDGLTVLPWALTGADGAPVPVESAFRLPREAQTALLGHVRPLPPRPLPQSPTDQSPTDPEVSRADDQ